MFFFFKTPRAAAPTEAKLIDKFIHMDFVGALCVVGAASFFVLAMHWAGVSKAWSDPAVIGALVASGLLVIAFIANEWLMGDLAMIQSHLVRKKEIATNLVFMFFLAGLYFPLLFALPIQFQSIDNDSASQSGVRLIPLVLGISVFTMVSNGLISAYRKHLPMLVTGAVLGTIGAVLIYTLDASASLARWISYEVLTAIGIGLSLQIPMIANQGAVTPSDIPAVTSMTLFVENLGTSFFVATGEAAFANRLVSSLAYNAPDVDPSAVVQAGATQLRSTFASEDISGIVQSYLEASKANHIMSVVCGGAATIVAFMIAAPEGRKAWELRANKPHAP